MCLNENLKTQIVAVLKSKVDLILKHVQLIKYYMTKVFLKKTFENMRQKIVLYL